MGIRIKKVRRNPEGPGSREDAELVRGIAALLPAGAQFGIVVLLPEGRGRFIAAGDGPGLTAALRRLLDVAEAEGGG
jgi:hypothetical protein